MDDHEALASAILTSRRIKNRLVILCEGERPPLPSDRAPSPQLYRRSERLPDANFYKSCVPPDWQGDRLPQFFNCGGRSQVLAVYRQLLERHQAWPEDSYLTPDKLYVLVDLDIQPDQLPVGYPWQTTEDAHEALYQDGRVTSPPGNDHRIWVTALVHKEAFFVLPQVAAAWEGGVTPFFNGAPLALTALHDAVAKQLTSDGDVARHLEIVRRRLQRFRAGASLDCTDGASLGASWRAAATQCTGAQYDQLLSALLSVAKAKAVWSQVTPDPGWNGTTIPAEDFRDQLALMVADTIARTAPDQHPLSYFFSWLKQRR